MHTHSSKEPFTCEECDYKTFSKYSLSRHYPEYGQNASYECNDCHSKFRVANTLAKHALLVHKIKEPFSCSQCNSCYLNKSNFTHHRYCDLSFSMNNHLKTHIRNRTGENPYKCTQCDKAFLNKSSLIIHLKTNSGDKPHQCNLCDKVY